MSKTIKYINYFVGGYLIMNSLLLLSKGDITSYVGCIMSFALAIIFLPTFNLLCTITDKKFSLCRKITLGFGTLFLPVLCISVEDNPNIDSFGAAVTALVIFWIIMFATNKKKYFANNEYIEPRKNNSLFNRLYNRSVEKHNKLVFDILESEKEIKDSFTHLDVLTINAIAKMVSENNDIYNSRFNDNVPKVNISEVIMAFCKDSHIIENEFDLNNLYTTQYYTNMINKNCSQLSNFIKSEIKETLSNQNKRRYKLVYNQYINIFLDMMNTYAETKFYRMITSNQKKELDKYKDYGIDENVDFRYRDAFIYLIDILATCTCIAKMIFIERKVAELSKTDEFYKIISNMTNEIKDIDLIIKKSRPIYDEFYKTNLGYINDDLNYSIAVTIISNKMHNELFSEKDKKLLNVTEDKAITFYDYDIEMKKWINSIAYNYRNLDVDVYIVFKAINSIEITNFDLLFKALSVINDYSKMYYSKVDYNNIVTDKDRYLKGDFEKEKKELSGKYLFNNITTGTQFELYLVNLFKDLGYKAKHNGKSGDQGADLILKKGDYVYAVQAKYYTGKLSNTPVQEIAGALKFYNANQGVVVTNSEFTPGAEELAKANNVILIDGKDLKKLADYTFEEDHSEDVLKKFEK